MWCCRPCFGHDADAAADRTRLLPNSTEVSPKQTKMDRMGPAPDLELKLDSGGEVCNRRALLIGINYIGTSGELAGCVNDVR